MHPQLIALLALALGPLLLLLGLRPEALPWLAWGAGLWALALLAKLLLLGPLYVLIEPRLKNQLLAAGLWGLCSALAELGLTAWLLLAQPSQDRVGLAIWLGLGTGIIEIVYLLGLEAWQQSKENRAEPKPVDDAFVAWSGVLERSYTLVGHVCSRGLLALGLQRLWLLPLALGLFSCVDGFATYTQLKGWDFAEPATARRFQLAMTLVSLLEALIFVLAGGQELIFAISHRPRL
ncbi:MAG: hypothetical protein ACAI44_29290 [Candidatus Sericytochromatia bacterium]